MNLAKSKNQPVTWSVATEKSEWGFVAGTLLFVLVVTSLPYLFAYLTTPADKQFMGIMVNVPDHMQYFSWMRELTTANLSANKLTPEPNAPVFFNLLWWSMGRLAALLGVSYAVMFQLLRLVATTLFLVLAYRICSWYFADRLMRRTAFLLIVFAGGVGWLLVVLKYTVAGGELPYPLLVFVSEPNTFFNILAFPHFIAAALYVFVFDLVQRGQQRRQLKYAVFAGLVALFFGWQHAYDLVLVYGILGFYTLLLLLRDRRLPWYMLKSMLIIGVISWWPALYSVLLTSLDPLWKDVLAQFANAGVYTPNPLQLLILLGPTFWLAIFWVVKENPFRLSGLDDKTLFLNAWFVANFALNYIPTDYQIHMLNGWQIPIAILATQALFFAIIPLVQKITRRWQMGWSRAGVQRAVILGLIILVIPTNIYLWAWRFIDLGRHDYPYYLTTDEVNGLGWLDGHVQSDDVVLSSMTVGQYIPALTGAHAFLAHWAQTVDFFNKSDMVGQFFAPTTTDTQRQKILADYSVDYVFYGPAERQIGQFDPNSVPYLQVVHTLPTVTIYQVKR